MQSPFFHSLFTDPLLEIVERADENKNREGFDDRQRKRVVMKKKTFFFSFFRIALALLFRALFARVLVDFRKEKEKNVCVQGNFFGDIFIGITVFGSLVPNKRGS